MLMLSRYMKFLILCIFHKFNHFVLHEGIPSSHILYYKGALFTTPPVIIEISSTSIQWLVEEWKKMTITLYDVKNTLNILQLALGPIAYKMHFMQMVNKT